MSHHPDPVRPDRPEPGLPDPVHTATPHEHGRNVLVDPGVVDDVVDRVRRALRPGDTVVEIGAGDGALTRPLAGLGVPVRAFEIDPPRARRLDRRLPAHVEVRAADVTRMPWPRMPHVAVSNAPFGLTTALLRRLLVAEAWHSAVLLLQWEAARRRAGIGGTSLLTVSWWPWFTTELGARVPARAFRPTPAVDGGIVTITRRAVPLVADRAGYQRFVRSAFTGRGRGVLDVLVRGGLLPRHDTTRLARELRLSRTALPRDLGAEQWAALFHASREAGDHRARRRR